MEGCDRVDVGEAVTLIGPNGAGKSTLLKTIFGLLRPTAGQIQFDHGDVTGLRPPDLVRQGMSYVPQVDNVFPSLTVQENLEMGAFVRDAGIAERRLLRRTATIDQHDGTTALA